MIKHRLTCHPATPASLVSQLTATISELTEARIKISFEVAGDLNQLLIPKQQTPNSRDNIWQHTCFEFFIAQAECENYYEFNFSPSTLWAVYAFDSYRIRREWTTNEAPNISVSQTLDHYQLDAVINLADLPLVNKQDSWLIGLTAVLETQQNEHSYWALKHPEVQPNFHHRNGFIPFSTLA